MPVMQSQAPIKRYSAQDKKFSQDSKYLYDGDCLPLAAYTTLYIVVVVYAAE